MALALYFTLKLVLQLFPFSFQKFIDDLLQKAQTL